jgi:hypothetical protein
VLDDDGSQAHWPKAHAIVGNPPFLGDRKLTTRLGSEYTSRLRGAFESSIIGSVDLVCYWFDKARRQVLEGATARAGLVATNSIRGGTNRQVLDKIDRDLGITVAWGDEPWVLDGAAVRVSIVCFGRELADTPVLNGQPVSRINPDLTALAVNLGQASPLGQNRSVAFNGIQKTARLRSPVTRQGNGWSRPAIPTGALTATCCALTGTAWT